MKEEEPTYTITPKGNLTLDLSERMETMLVEQRAAVCALLGEAHRHLRRHECLPAALSVVEALQILDLPIRVPS